MTEEAHKQSPEQIREVEAGKGHFLESAVFLFGITGGN
jgi:hypothetical protein